MIASSRPLTSTVNGRLWGARADDWAAIQERVCAPVYDAVLPRCDLTAGMSCLDVGCGAGMAAERAARDGVHVAGVDASKELLAIARSRVPDGDFRLADLEALPFGDGGFDVVTGFNAFQYAANPVAALAEAKRVCRVGGRIAVVTWGDPARMEAASLVTALRGLSPPPPPGSAGPFALSDEAVLRKLATDAGLEPLEVFDVESPFVYADEATALRGLNSSGLAVRAMEASSEAAVTQAHRLALAPFRRDDGSYVAAASFRCLLATH